MEIQLSDMSVGMLNKAQEQQELGAELITKTLDNLNQNQSQNGSTNTDYELKKDVLSTAATGKGSIINIIA